MLIRRETSLTHTTYLALPWMEHYEPSNSPNSTVEFELSHLGEVSNTWWALLQPAVTSCREVIGTAAACIMNRRRTGNGRVKW